MCTIDMVGAAPAEAESVKTGTETTPKVPGGGGAEGSGAEVANELGGTAGDKDTSQETHMEEAPTSECKF